ncbi:MAG TPA: hypothetical protein VKA48_03430 [Gammaproteobacteria bacterium]|nr:hypothetical protein [Gammaproteobacteria bacterium]
MGHISRWVIGVGLFTGLLVGGTAWLQESLVLVREGGPFLHWGAILLGLPLAAGLLLRLLFVPVRLFALLTGTALATAALFQLYRTQFWAEPPGYTELSLYFAVTAGLSHITAYPVSDTFRAFWWLLLFLLPGNYHRASTAGGSFRGRGNGPDVSGLPGSRFALNLIHGLVGLAALVVSLFSIFLMGQAT